MQHFTRPSYGKGTLPILLVALIISTLLSAGAALFWPKSIPTSEQVVPNINAQASNLASPLAEMMVKLGYGQARNTVMAFKDTHDDVDLFLYADTGMGAPSLLYKSSEQIIEPLKRIEGYQKENRLIAHQPLVREGQPVGELIISYTIPAPATIQVGDAAIGYTLAVAAFIAVLGSIILFSKRLNKGNLRASGDIEEELERIIESKDYKTRICEDKETHLKLICQSINRLLEQFQASIETDQAAQRELQNLKAGLETEVQARTLALEKATLNAERANDAKTTFLATMSHEIRTPMNGVIGTIDLLRQTELDGGQHRLTTIIRDSAFSLLGILDDILDFSKIEAGKLQIDNSVFSVSDTVEEVARVLSSVAKKRKLDLQLSLAPDIPNNLVGDTIRVRQVLYNLCSNAIKFTTTDDDKMGFVRISAEVAHNTSDHYTLRFTVTDNGKGMTQAQIREIFNPFIQAEGTITREYGGTGLGLSICKSLIELMLGHIQVTSDIGMGSEFVVELPFSIDGNVQFTNKNTLNAKKVVIFTEDHTRRAVLCRYLSFMGAATEIIDQSDDISEHQHQDDVIWVLDGLNGMQSVNETLRSLLYSLENHNQQVIVLSTMDESALNHQNIFYLNAAPLCKTSFMTAIMVAAGLHQPKQLKPSKTLNDYLSVEQARADNKLVLLVEDNLLNQQVLTDQLHLLGYGVEVAENGEEGLKLWQKDHFPIILTDLHMPKMSGYDMVKQIRDLAEKSEDINAQPYVIAVTANALKGERDRCISAGMNDYITKPVELNVLEKTLLKWQEKHPQASSSSPNQNSDTELRSMEAVSEIQPEVEEEQAAPPINMDMLGKYVSDDEAKKLRFFRMYLEQSSQLTRDINGAVITMNQEEIIEACHQLKSISKTIGAERVAEVAVDFELECKNTELSSDQLIAWRDKLESAYLEATEYIQLQLQNSQQEA